MSEWKPIEFVSKISNLPTLPTTISAILYELSNPDSSAVDLAKLIASDQSLAGNVLKVVNSAYYSFHRRISSLTEAIVILGYKEIRKIILSITAFKFISTVSKNLDRKRLWNHALACAITANIITRKCKIFEEGCFESGLLHDIGKVVFDYLDSNLFSETVDETLDKGSTLYEVEPNYFGATHTEVGSLLARQWNLPDRIIKAIQYHHTPGKVESEYEKIVYITSLANCLTYEFSLGDGVSSAPYVTVPTSSLCEVLSIEYPFPEDFLKSLKDSIFAGIESFIQFE
ncbi:MAG: HDOD domain-containing protein [Candidatus Hydrogenedentes bacterium]|nr:HDOD domain-containing protein [Candidatus Hydrogenedentota bacterium]